MKEEAPTPIAQSLRRLRESGGLKSTDIANYPGVSAATALRWTSGHKTSNPRTQHLVSDLAYVLMRLLEFYSADEIRACLHTRHLQIEDHRAIDPTRYDGASQMPVIINRLGVNACT